MQLFLRNQHDRFPQHLERLKQEKIMPYDKTELKEKNTVFPLERPAAANTDFLFRYDIFPDYILTGYPQWEQENREMRVGDTIVQQAFLPPVKRLSVKTIFGVRICAVIDEPDRKGFSYETLQGHAERGISTFTVEQEHGREVFRIHTFSTPGNRLSRLFAAIFTVPYQAFCTRAAGRKVQRMIR